MNQSWPSQSIVFDSWFIPHSDRRAEEVGLEPTYPCGRRLSKPLRYRSAHPSVLGQSVDPVDSPGIEPGLQVCQTRVIPLDHEPHRQWIPRGVAPRSPACEAGVFLLDDGPSSVTEVGIEPTLHRFSTCRLCRLAYPVIQLQTWELNPASRLMRPGRTPVRLQSCSQ